MTKWQDRAAVLLFITFNRMIRAVSTACNRSESVNIKKIWSALKVETVSTFNQLKVETVSTFNQLKVETVSTFSQLKVETLKN